MTTLRPQIERRFREEGYPDPTFVGAGMEGSVYQLVPGLVAKIWQATSEPRVRALQTFYRGIQRGSSSIAIATPEIYDVWTIEGQIVTIERELDGTPLEGQGAPLGTNDAAVVEIMVDVLDKLAAISPSDELWSLSVLDETEAFGDGSRAWSVELCELVQRRVDQFAAILGPRVDRFEDKVAAVLRRVPEVASARPTGLVHGDLITANVLVDKRSAARSVLDFGFLSMPGDPAFEAAVTSSIVEMYGPEARAVEQRLGGAFGEAFGYPSEDLLVYRAAYALITSNAYDSAGEDGHFAWCADMLGRDDVADALLSS